MTRQNGHHRSTKTSIVRSLALGVCLLAPPAVSAQTGQPLFLQDFSQAAPQGFGDLQNSMARASVWWNGKLYVATSRAFACIQQAILAQYVPGKSYPPPDPSLTCTPDANDLPLQAEIWRWDPSPDPDGTWDRVYQSPQIIPIPNTTKMTAREIGFRDMVVFAEPDGTEALYVTGQNAKGFIAGLGPPTILRSTDGQTFAPIPQEPGTVLGDLDMLEGITISSFNRITTFNGRLYVVAGGDFGHGVIFESANPALGNDSFQRVSAPGMTFTYMAEFNNALYVAQGAQPSSTLPPYRVLKLDTTQPPPYPYTVIVDGARTGALNLPKSSRSVATMHVAGQALWVSTNQPPELVRINPNDTWDLFMGQPRITSTGVMKNPMSGLGDGFDWFFNIHIHRMQDHDGFLYAFSNDLSNSFPLPAAPGYTSLFGERFGFDAHRTKDGWYFYPITMGGFQELDPGGVNNWSNFTGRVANSTPYGLFVGTGNNQFGLQIWRGKATALPAIAPPQMLESEKTGSSIVLYWLPSPTATLYHVLRADYEYWFQLGVPFYAGGTIYPSPFTEIGTTTDSNFTDTGAGGLYNQYYVIAEDALGRRSDRSNLVRSPSLITPTTFTFLKSTLTEWAANNEIPAALQTTVAGQLNLIKLLAIFGNYNQALTNLQQLTVQMAGNPLLAPWRKGDFQVLALKLGRRIDLARLGKIPAWMVWY